MPYDEFGEWYDDGTDTPGTPEQPTEPTPEQPAEEITHGWNLTQAVEYIELNAIDNEDFLDAEDKAKTRLLNVSHRTLTRKYPTLIIPDKANYLFATVLATAYNDTNKLQQQGVAGFSIKGISFTFKDWAKKGLDALIPDEVVDIIAEENGVVLKRGRAIKAVTL